MLRERADFVGSGGQKDGLVGTLPVGDSLLERGGIIGDAIAFGIIGREFDIDDTRIGGENTAEFGDGRGHGSSGVKADFPQARRLVDCRAEVAIRAVRLEANIIRADTGIGQRVVFAGVRIYRRALWRRRKRCATDFHAIPSPRILDGDIPEAPEIVARLVIVPECEAA